MSAGNQYTEKKAKRNCNMQTIFSGHRTYMTLSTPSHAKMHKTVYLKRSQTPHQTFYF